MKIYYISHPSIAEGWVITTEPQEGADQLQLEVDENATPPVFWEDNGNEVKVDADDEDESGLEVAE